MCYVSNKNKIPYKDFTKNTLFLWQYYNFFLLLTINFTPIFFANNTLFSLYTWQVGLYSISLVSTMLVLQLISYNPSNLKPLLYNDFFLILLLYLPTMNLILITTTNLLHLYIILEIFAVILLILLYTSNITTFSKGLKKSFSSISRHSFLLIFYQFIFNFYASFIFALLLILFAKTFGTLNFTFMSPRLLSLTHFFTLCPNSKYHFIASYLPVLFILFFLIKFGVGPWFYYKLTIYRYLSAPILLVYIYIYFIFLLPYGIWLIYSYFHISYLHYPTLVGWLVLSVGFIIYFFPKIDTLSVIISLSSIIFYLFVLSQLLFIL